MLLEAALETRGLRYLQMSTDEVYGTLDPSEPSFTEETNLAPRSPYSASNLGRLTEEVRQERLSR